MKGVVRLWLADAPRFDAAGRLWDLYGSNVRRNTGSKHAGKPPLYAFSALR